MAGHHGGCVTRDSQNVVTGHDQALPRQRVEHLLAKVRIAGADDDELLSGVGQQHLGDIGLCEERREPRGL